MGSISTFEGKMDQEILDKYYIFDKESKVKFEKDYYGSISLGDYKYTALNSQKKSESYVVKKAKLVIYNEFKLRERYLFNEISVRKGSDCGAPVIDLYDPEKRFGIELHWHSKKINHKEMIERMKVYNKRFGTVILLFLQWGDSNGWKRLCGIDFLHRHVEERYKAAGINYQFFNVDKPSFDWLIG